MPYFGSDNLCLTYVKVFLKKLSSLLLFFFTDVRLKLLTTMLIIIVAFVFSLFLLKFGIGVVEDNFASELTTNYKSSAEFMALYGILNFTFYAMAYVYTPSTSLPFGNKKYSFCINVSSRSRACALTRINFLYDSRVANN